MSQNTYLSTDGSEIVDVGEDIQDLMIKVNNLESQNEFLVKQLRETEHNMKSQLEELKIQNTSLKRTNESLEELLKSYKNQGTTKPENSPVDSQKKLRELESKLLLIEQSEQNLKRTNQSLNREILDLRIKVDNLTLGGGDKNGKKEQTLDEDFYDLDNMDEEKKVLIKEVLKDYEDVKKENLELRENALNTIAEKEMANIDLRDKIEQMKEKYNAEIHKLMLEVQDYRSKCMDVTKHTNEESQDDDKISLTSEEERELIDNYTKLTEDYEKLKKEFEEKDLAIDNERSKWHHNFERLERSNKDLQIQVFKLTSEVNNYEYEKSQLEKVVSQDSQSKNILVNELEHFQQLIRNLEDMKEKNEHQYKDHINQLNHEIHELDLAQSQLKEQKGSIEKELNELKVSFNRKIKEIQDKSRMDILNKDKEIQQYKDRIENLDKERENYKNDAEIHKKNSEKMKVEFKELRDQIKKIKEEQENEKRKWEEKLMTNEKKTEIEKKGLFDQINNLQTKLTAAENAKRELINISANKESHKSPISSPKRNTLEDVLDDEGHSQEIYSLKNDLAHMTKEISEYKLKINSLQKLGQELEIVKKENEKFKNDIKDITEMYENQIKELQEKAVQVNAELQSSRKKSFPRKSIIDKQQMQIVNELEKDLVRLNAENKYLNEKLDIQGKEVSQVLALNENNIKFLKQELTIAEQAAINAKVALATLAYEKDCEIIKHKNSYKRLKAKVQAAMGSQTNSQGPNSARKK